MTVIRSGILQLVFVFIFLITSIEGGCENCGCCVNNTCADKYIQGYTVTEYCTYGCIQGIAGNKCKNNCTDDCVTCEQSKKNNCATCDVGKYLSSEKRCVDCPVTCTKCSSSTYCEECKSPYYNHSVTNDCSLSSCPVNCVCSTPGVCSECQDGYFNVNEQCNRACLDKCVTCSDYSTCPTCNEGYYNGIERVTNIMVTNCSLPCRDMCVHCTSYESCTICKTGYYGSFCQNSCSVGCKNNVCDKNDGSCVCNDGFTGSDCTVCAAGRHGKMCEEFCPDTCNDMNCERATGNCFKCKSGNITGEKCEKCLHGTWGTQCSSACPKNCNGQCIRESGFCKSCTGIFQGDLCNDCPLGYHGEECNANCPKNCFNSLCYQYNGTCQQCNVNYTGPTCEDCSPGMYGQNCDVPCLSLNCSSNICEKNTGICTSCPDGLYGLQCEFSCSSTCNDFSCEFVSGACSGCKENFTGDKCCVEGGHCRNCSSSTLCKACDDGYFGEKCDETCPISCTNDGQEHKCEKTYGKCLSCRVGFHGDYCHETCGDRCFNNRCDRDNGHCVEGCAGDFEGPTCTQALTNIAPVVGGGAAGFVVIIVLVVLLVVLIRRRRSRANRREDYIEDKQTGSPQLPGPLPKLIDNKPIYSNDDLDSAELEEDIIEDDSEDIVINIPEGRDAVYENVTNATVSGLEAYVRKKTEEDYKHEFAV